MGNPFKEIIYRQSKGIAVGIYSVCSAHPLVIKAALKRGKETNTYVLIESTANQCNQDGGYTGMKPKDFSDFVYQMAKEIGFDQEKLILGGDHLGPLIWTDLDEQAAMEKAKVLIYDYVYAGFTKIHLDTSMRLASDSQDERLSDQTIARRGAELAVVAKKAYQDLLQVDPEAKHPVFIIGSEVPIPGGSTDSNQNLQITKAADFEQTVKTFQQAFSDYKVDDIFQEVVGIVVQPGLEENDLGCVEYDREKAQELKQVIKNYPHLVFEGHSTDYQTKEKLRELVEDRVAILKVGPALTFALREALFALAFIEKELYQDQAEQSNFMAVLDAAMLKDPTNWQKHYQGTAELVAFKRKYSFSDRCRYYLMKPEVLKAQDTLFNNLTVKEIPLSLISQFLPEQYTHIRTGLIDNKVEDLILDKIIKTIDEYLAATQQEKLIL